MVLMSTPDINQAVIELRRRMKDKGFTQGSLAQRIGRVQSWVSTRLFVDPDATLRHLAYKEPQVLDRLLGALEWTLTELNQQTGLAIPIKPEEQNEVELSPENFSGHREILVYDMLSGGPGADGGTVIDTISISDEFKGEHVAYEVQGESMAPDIESGDRVVVKVQDYASPGNEIVCYVPDYGMLVKYLKKIEGGQHVLTSYNPAYKPIWATDITIYGVVVEVRKRRKVVNGNHGTN